MKDLSHISVPGKITVSGSFALMPQSDMDGLSDRPSTDQAARLMGLESAVTQDEEVPGGGSE